MFGKISDGKTAHRGSFRPDVPTPADARMSPLLQVLGGEGSVLGGKNFFQSFCTVEI